LPRLPGATLLALTLVAPGEIPCLAAAYPPVADDESTTSVTVEATRQHVQIEKQISHFVSSNTVNALDEPLARWQTPICPLVSGLPQDQGELVLGRVSQIARDAGAPLDTPDCRAANLLIIVTDDPEELLKQWWHRYSWQFNEDRGIAGLRRFVGASRPVRIWYNVVSQCVGTVGAFMTRASGPVPACSKVGGGGTHLRYDSGMMLRVLSSAMVVVDARQVQGLHLGQLSDYIAMLALAHIRENADPGDGPTILHLFGGGEGDKPLSLSRWDQDFLSALYHTDPGSTLRLTEIKIQMFRDLVPY
jgi:hypothetical protein